MWVLSVRVSCGPLYDICILNLLSFLRGQSMNKKLKKRMYLTIKTGDELEIKSEVK